MTKAQVAPAPRALERFEKSGDFVVGVEYAGGRHTEFTIGPLTVEAEAAADAELPDWIDPDLIWQFGVASLSDAERAELKLPAPTITAAGKRRAARMVERRYAVQVAHRVLRLGGIPGPEIAAAVGKLLASDMKILLAAAEGVDADVDRFREEAEKRLAESGGAGSGGDPTPPVGQAAI